jgi:hypothetical protein
MKARTGTGGVLDGHVHLIIDPPSDDQNGFIATGATVNGVLLHFVSGKFAK